MRIENERQLLPLARQPWILLNSDSYHQLMPLFESFLSSEIKEDSYKGWALDVHFIKQSSELYQRYINSIDVSKSKDIGEEWTFFPSHDKDDNVLFYHKNEMSVLIVFHLHSFLWNYPTPEETDEETS